MATCTAINCRRQSSGAMQGTLDYVTQQKKTRWNDAVLVTGHNCVPQSAYTEMLTTKQRSKLWYDVLLIGKEHYGEYQKNQQQEAALVRSRVFLRCIAPTC